MRNLSVAVSTAVVVAGLAFGLRPAPAAAAPALGSVDPLLGSVILFAGNFAPEGWAKCEGQILEIAQHNALFSLLGTTYGGDGETTFALPDLRGRAPVGAGQGPGLSHHQLGQKGGAETVTLTAAQMPSHRHTLFGQMEPGGTSMPAGRTMAQTLGDRTYGLSANVPMADDAVAHAGGGQAHENRTPHLPMTYLIALVGVFPSRD